MYFINYLKGRLNLNQYLSLLLLAAYELLYVVIIEVEITPHKVRETTYQRI